MSQRSRRTGACNSILRIEGECQSGLMRMEDDPFNGARDTFVLRHSCHLRCYSRLCVFLLAFLFFSSLVSAQSTDLPFSDDDPSHNPTTFFATQTGPDETATFFPTTDVPSASASSSDSATRTTSTVVNTSPITIPRAFDTAQLSGSGSNFTSATCPQFMRTFLSNSSFQSCVPFSLLLYTSSQFIQMTRTVRPVLWYVLILAIVCR